MLCRPLPRLLAVLAGVALLVATGCVRRTIRITSDPSGALVWVNDREIGRTPVDVDFLHYGTYDVRIVKEAYEPLLTFGEARAPWWDTIPLDLAAELYPGELVQEIHWHYTLEQKRDDRGELVDRARQLRREVATAADEAAETP